jgi:SAM-dependent methyltransferase
VDDWLTTNQRLWDERVPLHVGSTFYDVEGFKSGRPTLLPHEVDELGPLDGLRLVHLQCHFGLDSLDIARLHPTVNVTGLDFSAPAINAAAKLAAELRMGDRARFVLGDVYRAPTVLGDQRFDVVYTGKGALLWLPDLDRWASVVRELLAPGGFLYLTEFHPVADVLDAEQPFPVRDYFATEPTIYDEPGSYVDTTAPTVHNVSYEWQHPISRLMTALIGAGLRLELFHEWDFTNDPRWKFLVKRPDGRGWRWPPGLGTLPLMYSLKAYRPA